MARPFRRPGAFDREEKDVQKRQDRARLGARRTERRVHNGPGEPLSAIAAPITVAPEAVFGMIGIAFIAMLFGMVVAVPVNAIGAAAMLALGELYAPARTRTAWMLAGGVIGGIAAWLMAAPPELGFALVATSALCGRLCNAGDAEA
jgi:hypothetical protein